MYATVLYCTLLNINFSFPEPSSWYENDCLQMDTLIWSGQACRRHFWVWQEPGLLVLFKVYSKRYSQKARPSSTEPKLCTRDLFCQPSEWDVPAWFPGFGVIPGNQADKSHSERWHNNNKLNINYIYITILISGIEHGSAAQKSCAVSFSHKAHAELLLRLSMKHSTSIPLTQLK